MSGGGGAVRQSIMKAIERSHRNKQISPQIKEAAKKTKWNILRGDTVQVIGNHPDRGKQGVVLRVQRKKDRVFVEGLNIGAKWVRANPLRGEKGKTLYVEKGIHYSKVNLVDPVTGLPTRVYRKVLEDGTKVRIAKKSGAVIPKSDILTERKVPVKQTVTDKDTVEEDVWEDTLTLSLQRLGIK